MRLSAQHFRKIIVFSFEATDQRHVNQSLQLIFICDICICLIQMDCVVKHLKTTKIEVHDIF